MLKRILSHDLPRNRWLALVLVAIVVALALTPCWLMPQSAPPMPASAEPATNTPTNSRRMR